MRWIVNWDWKNENRWVSAADVEGHFRVSLPADKGLEVGSHVVPKEFCASKRKICPGECLKSGYSGERQSADEGPRETCVRQHSNGNWVHGGF